MADVLVDTDVFVDHLRGARPLRADGGLSYSVITRCELFAGGGADEAGLRSVLDPLTELPVGRDVAETAGRIRRERGLRTPDALIAATAVLNGLALLTRNRKDFERVPRLRVRAPA